jgi:hypothetical protein
LNEVATFGNRSLCPYLAHEPASFDPAGFPPRAIAAKLLDRGLDPLQLCRFCGDLVQVECRQCGFTLAVFERQLSNAALSVRRRAG